MNYSNYRITLDVRKTVASVQLTAKKGDAGRKIYITLSDKGSPCQIADGCYAVFAGRKPDGTLLYNKTTIEDNTIIYAMTQQTTAVAGLVACEVKLFDSMSNLLTSPKLTILVDDVVVSEEEIVSKDEVTALTELITEATATIELGNQTIEISNIAAEAANAAAGNANTEAIKAAKASADANTATANANKATSDASAAAKETNAARENIQKTASEVLSSLSGSLFAPPIDGSATGKAVAVNDASNQPVRGITLYGKTTHNGTPAPETPADLVSFGPMGTTTTGVNSAKEMVVAMRQIGSLNIDRAFEAYVGKVSYEIDYRVELNGCTEVDPNVFVVRGIDATGKDASILNVKTYVSESGITFGTYDGDGENPISAVCEEGKTYRVKAILDPDTSTYELYIDGNIVIKDRKLRCAVMTFNGVRLTVHRSGGRTVPRIYFDNLTVTGHLKTLLSDDFSKNSGKWILREADDASITFNASYHDEAFIHYEEGLCIRLNPGRASDMTCTYSESIDGSKITTVDFDFYLTCDSYSGIMPENFEANVLLKGTATAVNIGAKLGSNGQGIISSQYSNTKSTFYTGDIHHVRVITDSSNKKVFLFLDGQPVDTGKSYVNGQTSWDTLILSAKNNTSDKREMCAYFDNLIVKQYDELSDYALISDTFDSYRGWSGGIGQIKDGNISLTITDGTDSNIQTFVASTPNGLPGVPLGATRANAPLMDGVYWNEEDQKYYIADTIDYGRNVYTQRTVFLHRFEKSSSLTNTDVYQCKYGAMLVDNLEAAAICSVMGQSKYKYDESDTVHYYCKNSDVIVHVPKGFDNSNGLIQVLAVLREPVESTLPVGEMESFALLHSNRPNTKVYNDADALMEFNYVVDTKTYIDQKIAALLQQ